VSFVAEIVRDQAEGLRRLFTQDFVRVVTVAGGRTGVGKTHVVINLAVSLARRGKRVLVLDGQHGKNNLAALLGIKPRFTLTHVIRRERMLEEVMVEGPQGIGIIQAAQGLKSLAGLDIADQDWLVRSFEQLSKPLDVVLVDAGSVGNQSSLSLASQEIIIVVSGHHDSITEAYGLIKRLSRNFAKRHFHILVNKADTEHEARAVYHNMAQVAGRFLDVSLDFMGFIPLDEKLKQAALLCRPVAEAFPSAEAALAFKEMAEVVDLWPHPTDDSGRIESFMQRLIISSRMTQEVLNSSVN
jgi:flagellar biosynthesis protein FlhG